MPKNTPEYQDAEEVAVAIADVTSELNAAEDSIDEGEYAAAAAILRQQIDELTVIMEWCNHKAPEEST